MSGWGNPREGLLFAERRFRHCDTGEEAVLIVQMHQAEQNWFLIRATRPDGTTSVPRVTWGVSARDLLQARAAWREGERELRAAGYERIPGQLGFPSEFP